MQTNSHVHIHLSHTTSCAAKGKLYFFFFQLLTNLLLWVQLLLKTADKKPQLLSKCSQAYQSTSYCKTAQNNDIPITDVVLCLKIEMYEHLGVSGTSEVDLQLPVWLHFALKRGADADTLLPAAAAAPLHIARASPVLPAVLGPRRSLLLPMWRPGQAAAVFSDSDTTTQHPLYIKQHHKSALNICPSAAILSYMYKKNSNLQKIVKNIRFKRPSNPPDLWAVAPSSVHLFWSVNFNSCRLFMSHNLILSNNSNIVKFKLQTFPSCSN